MNKDNLKILLEYYNVMKTISIILLIILILCSCASKATIPENSTGQPANIVAFGKSKKYTKNGITVIYLSGSPYEIGLAHGKLCKEEIIEAHEYYLSIYDNAEWVDYWRGWLNLAKHVEKFIPKEYIEEMQGIGDGSGLGYDRILFLNLLTTIARRSGCFAFAFKESNSHIHIVRQIDLGLEQTLWRKMVLFIVKPEKGFSFAAFLNPGWVDGETGMNENGIYISQNAIHIRQTKWDVMPITHLTRYMLQYSATINDIENILKEQKAFPVKLLFVGSGKNASVFEFANDEKARIDMENGFLALSNHARLLPSRNILGNSQKRLVYANKYLKENIDSMDIEKALKLVKSSRISSFWRNGFQNRQSLLFSPSTLDFLIAIPPQSKIKPACSGPYVKFNLLNELSIFENLKKSHITCR